MNETLRLIEDKINEILKFAMSPREHWFRDAAILKGVEEQGELAEAILIVLGQIRHKTLPEDPTGEIADNINQIIDVYSYDRKTSEKIKLNLYYMSFKNFIDMINPRLLSSERYLNEIIINIFRRYRIIIMRSEGHMTERNFKLLINELFFLNVLIYYVRNKDTTPEITEELFNEANNFLLEKITEKFEKWKSISQKFV